jgi:N-sulfoglucosamine sulfohydrolase
MNKLLVSASVALGATSLSFAQQTEKPNFLLFIADDCSHYDLGCYGSVDSKTPNIDHFATQGVRFTQAYQAVPMSSAIIYIQVYGLYVAGLTPITLVLMKEH